MYKRQAVADRLGGGGCAVDDGEGAVRAEGDAHGVAAGARQALERHGPDGRAGGVLAPVVHGVPADAEDVDAALLVEGGGDAFLDVLAVQALPSAPLAVGLAHAAGEPLAGVADEEVDPAVGRGDDGGHAHAAAALGLVLGVAEALPGLEGAAGGALLQDDDLAAVGAALALEGGEAQGEEQAVAPGVPDGGQGGRQGPAAEVLGCSPAAAAGGALLPAHGLQAQDAVRLEAPGAVAVGDGRGPGVAVVGGADPALAVLQRALAALPVVAAAAGVAALPGGVAAVGRDEAVLVLDDLRREVEGPALVVVAAEGQGGEAGRVALAAGGVGHPLGHRLPGEERGRRVVAVVRARPVVVVLGVGGVVDLVIGVGVHGVDHRGPVPIHDRGEGVHERPVPVGGDRGAGGAGGDHALHHRVGQVPQLGQPGAAGGEHGDVEEDQPDPAAAVDELVGLGPDTTRKVHDGLLPWGELVLADHLRVRLAQALVAGGGIGGLVGLGLGHALDPVLADRLAGGDVDRDDGDAGGDQVPGVGVHEVQVVVGMGHDLQEQGVPGGVERLRGAGVDRSTGLGGGCDPARSRAAPGRRRRRGDRDPGEHRAAGQAPAL